METELGPLIGQRVLWTVKKGVEPPNKVTEMLSAFREQMTECLQGIALEHERAAQRLARDLAPMVTEELRQARHGGISEAQLEELTQAVELEARLVWRERV